MVMAGPLPCLRRWRPVAALELTERADGVHPGVTCRSTACRRQAARAVGGVPTGCERVARDAPALRVERRCGQPDNQCVGGYPWRSFLDEVSFLGSTREASRGRGSRDGPPFGRVDGSDVDRTEADDVCVTTRADDACTRRRTARSRTRHCGLPRASQPTLRRTPRSRPSRVRWPGVTCDLGHRGDQDLADHRIVLGPGAVPDVACSPTPQHKRE